MRGFGEGRDGPCGCSRGTCACPRGEVACLPGGTVGFPWPTGTPGSAGGRGVGRDTGGWCSTRGTPAGSAGLGGVGRSVGRDAGPPFAGPSRTGCSARGIASLDGATGTFPNCWPTGRWGFAGTAGSGTLAACCAREALSVHNNRPSAIRTQVAAATHLLRTATHSMILNAVIRSKDRQTTRPVQGGPDDHLSRSLRAGQRVRSTLSGPAARFQCLILAFRAGSVYVRARGVAGREFALDRGPRNAAFVLYAFFRGHPSSPDTPPGMPA
jgi:hypothetical protein